LFFRFVKPAQTNASRTAQDETRKVKKTLADCKTMVKELNAVCKLRKEKLEESGAFEDVKPVDVVAVVWERVEVLAHWAEIDDKGQKLKAKFNCRFEPMLHTSELHCTRPFPITTSQQYISGLPER
jgi:hypothetical protein